MWINHIKHTVSCSAEADAGPIFQVHEANVAALVAPHQGQDDDTVLLALEAVHCGHSNLSQGAPNSLHLSNMTKLLLMYLT